MSQNSRSDTVLTGHANLSGIVPTEEGGATQAIQPGRGSAPPPPPPAPSAFDGSKAEAKRIEEELRRYKERKRELKRQDWSNRAKGIHRSHLYLIGGLAGLGVVGWFTHSFLSFQRDTAIALAGVGNAQAAPIATAETVVDAGIENPLDALALTGRARWMIQVDDSGRLLSLRSSIVVADLMGQLDLCSMYIGVDDTAAIDISTEPLPGYVPFVELDGAGQPCAAMPVDTPADPVPPTTVPGA